jgi:SAM-dependent methyltransferase
VGSGGNPYPRSNVLLDAYESSRERHWAPLTADRQTVLGFVENLPFKDKSFDYVIASHVLEHVLNPEVFMSEIYRVGGGRGYLEFPLPPYEYLFNFDVHTQFVWFDEQEGVIKYLPKQKTALSKFNSISSELKVALELGWDDLVSNNLEYFFIGLEYERPIPIIEQKDLSQYAKKWQKNGNTLSRKLSRRLSHLLELIGLDKSWLRQ